MQNVNFTKYSDYELEPSKDYKRIFEEKNVKKRR